MDSKIEKLIQNYKFERGQFIVETYIGDSSWLRVILNKVRNHSNKDDVLSEEQNFLVSTLAKISKINPSKKQIGLAKLALENRNEYLSDLADFQVAYIALTAFCWAFIKNVLAHSQMPVISVVVALALLLLVLYAFDKRIKLKKEMQMNKEVVNIFAQYGNEHS